MIPVMAALGSGHHLWRVDVVLRRAAPTDDVSAAVVAAVTARLDGPDATLDEQVLSAPRDTYSFDMPPPEGSIGVSCWVRADDVGQAASVGHAAVAAAAQDVTGLSLPLWDLRVVPREAMMTRDEYGLR